MRGWILTGFLAQIKEHMYRAKVDQGNKSDNQLNKFIDPLFAQQMSPMEI